MTLEEFLNDLIRQSDGKRLAEYKIEVMEYIFDSAEYRDLEFDEIDVDHKRLTIFIK